MPAKDGKAQLDAGKYVRGGMAPGQGLGFPLEQALAPQRELPWHWEGCQLPQCNVLLEAHAGC